MPQVDDTTRIAFIVGAPRCGTTTLSRMLRRHAQVSFSTPKEPHFFFRHDLRRLPLDELRDRVDREYLAQFFDPLRPGEQVRAEGSVSYLYVPEQMEPIVRLWPDARFIVAVRDPMTMIPSLHQRLLFLGDENLTRFEDAWDAAADRSEGRRIPRNSIDPRWLRYDEAGRLGTYVERLFAAVGRERCHVVLFDDLRDDADGQARRLFEFVGVDPDVRVDIGVARPSRGVRYQWLQRALNRPSKSVQEYVAAQHFGNRNRERRLLDTPPVRGLLSLRKSVLRWNETTAPRMPIHQRVQDEMRLRFRDDVDRLGSLIGRDLSHWLQGSSSEESP